MRNLCDIRTAKCGASRWLCVGHGVLGLILSVHIHIFPLKAFPVFTGRSLRSLCLRIYRGSIPEVDEQQNGI